MGFLWTARPSRALAPATVSVNRDRASSQRRGSARGPWRKQLPCLHARGKPFRTVFGMDTAEDLSHQLWTLRELLEELVYKLEVQRLLLGAGKTRWLPSIDAELAAVIAAITEVDSVRQHAQAAVADHCGLARTA